MKNNNRGFTLIEIVMVLVLLGILAAVAIPKYYDLTAQAEKQTAKAIASEFQARLNAEFASQLLQGTVCSTARTNAISEAKKVWTEKAEKAVHGFTATWTDPAATADTNPLTLKGKNGGEETIVIAIPKCN